MNLRPLAGEVDTCAICVVDGGGSETALAARLAAGEASTLRITV